MISNLINFVFIELECTQGMISNTDEEYAVGRGRESTGSYFCNGVSDNNSWWVDGLCAVW